VDAQSGIGPIDIHLNSLNKLGINFEN
jgi:hypothetical protein